MVLHKNSVRSGFSLVEIMFVVSIIGLLSAIGVMAYQGAYRRVLARCITQDLRTAEKGIKLYICDHFELPKNTGADNWYMQPEFKPYFPNGWPSVSLLGVDWKWVYWAAVTGSCLVVDVADDYANDPTLRDAIELADEMMDDGNMGKGRLSVGSQGLLRYYIEDYHR